MNVYKKLMTNTALIALSTFGSKLLVFLLTPFYTRVLSEAEYGVMDNVVQLANLLIPIASVGIANTVIRFGMDSVTDRRAVYTFGIVVTALGSASLLLLYPLLDRIPYTHGYTVLVCFYVIAANFYAACSQFARSGGNVRLYAAAGILCTAVNIGLNILFLAVFRWGVPGYVLSSILADFTCAAFCIIKDRQWRAFSLATILPKERRATDWDMLRYAIPLIPTTICSWVINISDRFIITSVLGTAENGLYSISNKIPTILIIISNIFTYAWQLSAFVDQPRGERERLFSNVAKVYQAVAFTGAAWLMVTAKLSTIVLAAPSYYPAWREVPMLVLATTFCCLANFLTSAYLVDKRSVATFVTIFIGAVLNVAGNLLLVHPLGAMGCAISTCISYFVMFAIRFFHSRTSVRIRWDNGRFLASMVLVTALCIVMIADSPYSLPVSIALTAVVTVLNFRHLIKAALKLLRRDRGNA